ncbi:hypothetical protein [Streptomyces sp. Ru62]|uniref:hypothetical protein n=1 Tax=Streptomyces sp. Ru62 TaxID=2080745 RepID=UPI00215655A1|nr:hypothetical protein [Streptomyces sp. Ru62]
MLRILDARTGEPVPAAPARRGLTRIETHARGLDPTALRVLLTADLLVRALELGGTPVWTILTAPRDQPELRTAATHLAVRPFEDDRDLASGLGEAQVIHVAGWPTTGTAGGSEVAPGESHEGLVQGGPPGESAEGAAPAPAREESGEGPSAAVPRGERAEGPAPRAGWAGDSVRSLVPGARGEGPLAAVAPVEWVGAQPSLPALLGDPAALRLALLSVPRHQPARLDGSALDRAAGQLADWRRAVAGWARHPSRPVPEPVRGRLRAAWENDLDLPGVLDVLRDVACAPDLTDGARFETYAYADRLLALDLAHDLGSPA